MTKFGQHFPANFSPPVRSGPVRSDIYFSNSKKRGQTVYRIFASMLCNILYVSNNSFYVTQKIVQYWGVGGCSWSRHAGIGFIRPCLSPWAHLGLISQMCLVWYWKNSTINWEFIYEATWGAGGSSGRVAHVLCDLLKVRSDTQKLQWDNILFICIHCVFEQIIYLVRNYDSVAFLRPKICLQKV